MTEKLQNGVCRTIDGKLSVFYDGYWIRYYVPPNDTLAARKSLIEHLTKRTFHHTESGINTPGEKLESAREAYDGEQNPARKRVNAAMLAGALFNRATDMYRTLVDLAEKGVDIGPDNELMKQCGNYFKQALELGKEVKHYSGHEGIDELWGEPLKAFTMPIDRFYESRYIKIAQTMRDIDRIAEKLQALLASSPAFEGVAPLIHEIAQSAKLESETIRSDPAIFDIWPRFVAAKEAVERFSPPPPAGADIHERQRHRELATLLKEGKELISYLASARVPMPKSTCAFLERCACPEQTEPSLKPKLSREPSVSP
jgi:hypothetical protein